jgi:hypothetical protein
VDKPNLQSVVLTIILINAAGFLLRYFDIDTYIIIIGFRFHLSAVFSLLFILKARPRTLIKESFLKPHYKNIFPYLIWVFLPAGVLFALLFLTKNIEIGDPEFFYEFGLSSIIDYPIYLIWNAPQLFIVFLFLVLSIDRLRFRLTATLFLLTMLFAFEFIPLGKESVNYFDIGNLLILSMIAALLINYFRNIYLFSFLLFSVLWVNLLAFGSSSKEMVNLLFASQYLEWEGFFIANKEYSDYLFTTCQILTLVLVIIYTSFRKK